MNRTGMNLPIDVRLYKWTQQRLHVLGNRWEFCQVTHVLHDTHGNNHVENVPPYLNLCQYCLSQYDDVDVFCKG